MACSLHNTAHGEHKKAEKHNRLAAREEAECHATINHIIHPTSKSEGRRRDCDENNGPDEANKERDNAAKIIVAGDFNQWREKISSLMEEQSLKGSPLTYKEELSTKSSQHSGAAKYSFLRTTSQEQWDNMK